MLQDWEDGLIGNSAGTVSRMPRRITGARVVIDLLRGRRSRIAPPAAIPSAA